MRLLDPNKQVDYGRLAVILAAILIFRFHPALKETPMKFVKRKVPTLYCILGKFQVNQRYRVSKAAMMR